MTAVAATPEARSFVPARAEPARAGAAALLMVAAVALGLCLHIALISRLEHRSMQATAWAELRKAIALGTAPVGPTTSDGHLVKPGTPVALLQIPRLHLRQVVREGTTGGILSGGPGHVRSTVLPGQAGYSSIFGRANAYGGPFRNIHKLKAGDTIVVTTGAGKATYKVIGKHYDGSLLPPPPKSARLTLATARGAAFIPSGVVYVDADIQGDAQPAAAPAFSKVPGPEKPLGSDTRGMWELALLLQGLLLIACGAVWSWWRWGRRQTWIVFGPAVLLFGVLVGDQVTRLLPNLM